MSNEQRKRVAIIGGGVAGIVSAYLLSRKFEVTFFEKNNYLGGHTNTIITPGEKGDAIAVDTGFIVCNARNYPNFYKFLGQLGINLRDSEMSFSHYCETAKIGYRGPSITDALLTPANFLKPDFLRLVLDQRRFNRSALQALQSGRLAAMTLGDFVRELNLSQYFVEHYLIPLTAAIWSSPDCNVLDFPAQTFLTFFKNHGMLEFSKRPTWQTVVGGSRSYVDAFRVGFKGTLQLSSPVTRVRRIVEDSSVGVVCNGLEQKFDRVVLATHADESLKLLSDPSLEEQSLLGSWSYQKNHTVLHTDQSLLPPDKKLWASWNYIRRSRKNKDSPVGVTYYMNRLQGLKSPLHFCVTLNSTESIDPSKIIYQTTYSHPQYTKRAVASQPGLQQLSGLRQTYYCGSYFGYGFHEDAVSSAVQVANQMGVQW